MRIWTSRGHQEDPARRDAVGYDQDSIVGELKRALRGKDYEVRIGRIGREELDSSSKIKRKVIETYQIIEEIAVDNDVWHLMRRWQGDLSPFHGPMGLQAPGGLRYAIESDGRDGSGSGERLQA